MSHDFLNGAGIVVTRPTVRAANLCRRIAAAGGDALAFPTLAIHALESPQVPPAGERFDWLIFTSVPAVQFGLPLLGDAMNGPQIAAIGSATAEALREAGVEPAAIPSEDQQESEGLLSLPAFAQADGQRIVIVRGHGGRDLLHRALEERGAEVTLAEVYERTLPEQNTDALYDWWRQGRVDAIVITSAAGLENLHAMLDDEGRRFLAETQLVVPATRMIKLAQQFGVVRTPIVANGAADDALLYALETWWQGHRQDSQ